jgi:hypothetical protein
MQIFAMIDGLDNFAISVMIEPHETVATLFDKYEKRLVSSEMPHQFTAGYSIEHTRQGGLIDDDDYPDYIGMENGDPDAVAKYLTPAPDSTRARPWPITLARASHQRPS